MSLGKDKDKLQHRPPTPRWNPSIIVSPTSSFLHQRRLNPKAGRSSSPLRRSSLSEIGDTTTQHQYPYVHGSPSQAISSIEVLPIPAFPAMTDEELRQVQHEVDPRHVSFKVQPIHNTKTRFTMHPLPQLAHVQTSPMPRDQIPPSSMLTWSLSPEHAPLMAHGGSPFPHRAYSEPLIQSTSDGHTPVEPESHALVRSDQHSDSGSVSSSFSRAHPPITGGKFPRLSYGGKTLALLRSSCLSVVDTATSSDEHSSPPSATMPVAKTPSLHGSSGTHRRSAYPESSTTSTASSGSSSLSPLSDEFRSEMDVQIARYNNKNDRRVREIIDERLPEIFVNCEGIVRSMEREEERTKLLMKYRGGITIDENRGRAASIEPGTIHDFGRLPARELRRCHVTTSLQTTGNKRDVTSLQATLDDSLSSPFLALKNDEHFQGIKEMEKDIHDNGQSVHHNHDEVCTPSPTKQAHQDTKSPGSTSPSCQTRAGVSSSIKTSNPISPLLKPATLGSPSLKALSLEQAPVAHVNQEWGDHATSYQEKNLKHSPQGYDAGQASSSGESASSGRKRKRDHKVTSEHTEPTNANAALHLGTGHDACAVLATGVNAALATRINAGSGHVATSGPASASGGPSIMCKESIVGASTTTQNSTNLLINREVTKLIKGGNDILAAMVKDYTERADLLSKIEACRASTVDSPRNIRNNIDGSVGGMIAGRDNALAQLEQCLELVDMRHASRVRFGAMELHASCSGLYQMLQSVFA
ncbi:hypothetical protein BGZ95_007957 [Linnemannia exigua]|uniref:Uncharacterized protein n=1 Tax=Linnemannia exigua TaxID=604196 RepID=A0AAD4DL25_9FUNG|nr:hypothetical protein BGZ95_007957 [Linnemannia exigua]